MKTYKIIKKNKNRTLKCSKNVYVKPCSVKIQNYPMKNNFSLFFLKIMEHLGVTNVIGMPGGAIVPFYNNINKIKTTHKISIRFEMNGGYIALGTSRLSAMNIGPRKLTISYGTIGPGLANLLNPISAATLEQIPTIFCTETIESKLTNSRTIQNIQAENLVKNICKSYLVINVTDIKNGTIIEKMYRTLVKGFSYPRGAIVFIFKNAESTIDSTLADANKYLNNLEYYKSIFSIFKNNFGFTLKKEIKSHDIFTGLYNYEWKQKYNNFIKNNKKKIISTKNISQFLNLKLNKSQRPVMLIGLGAVDYIYELLNFCRSNDIPYLLTSPMCSYGNIDDKYYAFIMGNTGTHCGNSTIQSCDLLITWGTSLDVYVCPLNDNVFKHIECIITVNKNPEIYNRKFINYYIIGDGKNILNIINKQKVTSFNRSDWLNKIEQFKIESHKINSYYFSKDDNEDLKHGDIYVALQKYVDKNIEKTNKRAFFVTDSGSCQAFTSTYIHYKNKNYIFMTDYKYGSLGNGLGEAIGTALNNPNDIIICICGDGGTLCGSLSDYISIKEANITNIIFVIFENSGLGFTSETDIALTNLRFNYVNGYKYEPNWKSLLESLLIETYVIKNPRQMDKALDCSFKSLYKNSSVLVCILPYDALYSPIVHTNSTFDNQIYYKFDLNNEINKCKYSKVYI